MTVGNAKTADAVQRCSDTVLPVEADDWGGDDDLDREGKDAHHQASRCGAAQYGQRDEGVLLRAQRGGERL